MKKHSLPSLALLSASMLAFFLLVGVEKARSPDRDNRSTNLCTASSLRLRRQLRARREAGMRMISKLGSLRGGSGRDVLALDNGWMRENIRLANGGSKTVFTSPWGLTCNSVAEMNKAIKNHDNDDAPGDASKTAAGKKRGRASKDEDPADGAPDKRKLLEQISTELNAAMRSGDRQRIRGLMQKRDEIASQLNDRASGSTAGTTAAAEATDERAKSKGRGRPKAKPKPKAKPQPKAEENEANSEQSNGGQQQEESPHDGAGDDAGGGDGGDAESAARLKKLKETGHLDLGDLRKASATTYNGKKMINIREYYAKDGKELPGKKGISLSPGQWKVLKNGMKQLSNALKDEQTKELKLGDMRFAQVKEFKGRWYVDVREFYSTGEEEDANKSPTKKGIFLRPAEFEVLCEHARALDAELEDLET